MLVQLEDSIQLALGLFHWPYLGLAGFHARTSDRFAFSPALVVNCSILTHCLGITRASARLTDYFSYSLIFVVSRQNGG